jgi:hypothetical protein
VRRFNNPHTALLEVRVDLATRHQRLAEEKRRQNLYLVKAEVYDILTTKRTCQWGSGTVIITFSNY